jgi:nucleoside-diphosphate-sugar epimerase
MNLTTLVVGASGATGKFVVHQLLQEKQNVRAIVRSKERFYNLLDEIIPGASSNSAIIERLDVTEASILDISDVELQKLVHGCDAVVSCLGHNLSFKGIYHPPYRLVTNAVSRLCQAIETKQGEGNKTTKFILMGSDGVSAPGDDARSRSERVVLFLLRYLLPPHKDNEMAFAYLFEKNNHDQLEWTVVRPTDLINGSVTNYKLFTKPQKSLFASAEEGVATRANVAKTIVSLILTKSLWEEWKGKMPVVHDS